MRQSALVRALAFVGMLGATTQAWGRVEIKRSGNTVTYDVTVEDVAFKGVNLGGMDFVEAHLKGVEGHAGVQYNLGQPEIPVVRFTVIGDVKVQVSREFDQSSILLGKAAIKPSQPSWDKNMKVAPPIVYDTAAYKSLALLGSQEYSIEDAGSIRGQTQKLITLRPFQYRAASGQYHLIRSFQITVREPANFNKTESVTPTIAFVVGAKFATSAKVDELSRIKEAQGFRVQRLVVGQNGVTSDVTIRSALQVLLRDSNVNLRHAILIGDVEDVPSHVAKTLTSGVTDHFYRAIDTDSYDTDLNGPDIGVGRISVQSEAELAVVVEKISRYSTGKFAVDNWLNHPSFVTTHDRYQIAEGTHNAVIAKHFAPRNYDRVFPDANEKGGDKLFPITLEATAKQIVDHMKAGRSIINFSGHGSNTGWEDVTTADVKSFSDPNSLPYVIGNACITGDFRVPSVFGETWLRHPTGAIVYWGSMDSSYWDEDDILEKNLYDGLFDQGIHAFDLMHQNALAGVWKFYGGEGRSKYYWETYVTFGDPSLEFRTSRPAEVAVEGADAFIIGTQVSQIRVLAGNGLGVPGAHVTLRRQSDGLTVETLTKVDGTAVLNTDLFANMSEQLELNVFGSTIQSVAKTVPLISPDRPFFGLNNWLLNKRQGGGVFVGEQVALSAAVENLGSMASTGGRVFIAQISGPATAETSVAMVPALASRARGEIGKGLVISISNNATRLDAVKLVLGWESKEGSSGQVAMTIPILRAELAVVGIDYGTPDHEGISGSGDLFLTVKNIGNETIRNGVLTGVTGTCTTGVSGQIAIAELKPDQTLRLATPLVVTPDASCQSGNLGELRVKGTYQGGAVGVGVEAAASYLVGQLEIFIQSVKDMALAIPDKGEPVEKAFEISASGKIKDISIAVKIEHPFVGDLKVKLIAPDGTIISLQDNQGGSADNLEARWGRNGLSIEGLNKLVGTDSQGTWKVTVQDGQQSDVGVWQEVELEVRHW